MLRRGSQQPLIVGIATDDAMEHDQPGRSDHRVPAGLTANAQPTGITAGPDGAVWFTEYADSGRVGHIK